jgi:microcompartment protein CcmL/EutN
VKHNDFLLLHATSKLQNVVVVANCIQNLEANLHKQQQSQKHSLEGSGKHNTWSKAKNEAQTQSVEYRSIKLQAKLKKKHIVQH